MALLNEYLRHSPRPGVIGDPGTPSAARATPGGQNNPEDEFPGFRRRLARRAAPLEAPWEKKDTLRTVEPPKNGEVPGVV